MKRCIITAIFLMYTSPHHLQSASQAATPEDPAATKLHRQLTETDLSLEINVSLDPALTKDHNNLCRALTEIQSLLAKEEHEASVDLDELLLEHFFMAQQYEDMNNWIEKALLVINKNPTIKSLLTLKKPNVTPSSLSNLTTALTTHEQPRRLGKSVSVPANRFAHAAHAKHATLDELPSKATLSTTPPSDSHKTSGFLRWLFKKKVDQATAKKTGEPNAATPAHE